MDIGFLRRDQSDSYENGLNPQRRFLWVTRDRWPRIVEISKACCTGLALCVLGGGEFCPDFGTINLELGIRISNFDVKCGCVRKVALFSINSGPCQPPLAVTCT